MEGGESLCSFLELFGGDRLTHGGICRRLNYDFRILGEIETQKLHTFFILAKRVLLIVIVLPIAHDFLPSIYTLRREGRRQLLVRGPMLIALI